MKKRIILLIVSIFALAIPCVAQVTAIKAGRVVDTEAGTISGPQVILVEKGAITDMGPNVNVPSGANVIDLSKGVVLPGLFDMHTHLCMDVQEARDHGNYYYTTLNDPDSFRSIQGVVN